MAVPHQDGIKEGGGGSILDIEVRNSGISAMGKTDKYAGWFSKK